MWQLLKNIINFLYEATSESLLDNRFRTLYPTLDGQNANEFLLTRTIVNFESFTIETDKEVLHVNNDFDVIIFHTSYRLTLEKGRFAINVDTIRSLRKHKSGEKDLMVIFENGLSLISEDFSKTYFPLNDHGKFDRFFENKEIKVDDKFNFYLIEAYKLHCRERIKASVGFRNSAYQRCLEPYYLRYKYFKKYKQQS